ncbi:MAG TPA: DUF3307 domain-containing protein [Ignavibacteria bacterium]|nr:DUF3307 domain-containing protein [Ignavibacteria bacterium]
MTVYDLFVLQIISHILSDFFFQTDRWAKDKIKKGVRSKFIKIHLLITFILSWIFSFQVLFIAASFVIAGLHILFDVIKLKITFKYKFFADQLMHVAVITLCVYLYYNIAGINPIFRLSLSTYYLIIAAGYLICLKPSNILIREILNVYNIKVENNEGIMNAGKLIGVTERIISLTFLLYGIPEAVGFVIAGKSILRFRDTDTTKTEYVLVGTLLSFTVAILIGVAINILKNQFLIPLSTP